MEFLLEPLQFAFMRQALIAALLVGALGGLLGVFIVLRGLSYIGHGLSHAAFGGAVVGGLLQLDLRFAAAVVALGAAAAVDGISDGRRVRADAAIGIVTTALFAVGVVIISAGGRVGISYEAVLFGNILGINEGDLVLLAVVTAACFGVVFWRYRELFFLAFDEESAAVFGVRRKGLRRLFALLLALGVIASMEVVGVTMIAATLVVPAASLRMLTDSYDRLVIGAPILGAFVGVLGLLLSYHLDAASGATIVLVGATLFCACWGYRLYRDRYRFHVHAHRHGDVVHVHPHSHAGEHDHGHRLKSGQEPRPEDRSS